MMRLHSEKLVLLHFTKSLKHDNTYSWILEQNNCLISTSSKHVPKLAPCENPPAKMEALLLKFLERN